MGSDSLPLTVVLWLWNGWRPVYDYRHVNAMVRMLADFLTVPHRVICVTDTPNRIECETYPMWELENEPEVPKARVRPGMTIPPMYPNSYRRLKMFSPWAATEFPGQILSLDLDAVICANIDPLITDDDFKINKGRASPYNGGMWLLRTGTRTVIWNKFTPNAWKITSHLRYTGSDQAWISHILKNEPTWSDDDGVHHFSNLHKNMSNMRRGPAYWNGQRVPKMAIQPEIPDNCRIMFCAGSFKPWHHEFLNRFPELFKSYHSYFK